MVSVVYAGCTGLLRALGGWGARSVGDLGENGPPGVLGSGGGVGWGKLEKFGKCHTSTGRRGGGLEVVHMCPGLSGCLAVATRGLEWVEG